MTTFESDTSATLAASTAHCASGSAVLYEPAALGTAAAELRQAAQVADLRVLHVINGEDYSGAERVQDLLALRLVDYGCAVAFACVKPDRFAAARQSQETPLYEAPMKSRFDLRPALRLARLIRREEFDLVHTHSPRAVLIGSLAATLARVPLVHHVHGQTAIDTAPAWRNRVNAVAERLSLRRASAIIACSATAERYMQREGLAADKLVLIPNGVPSRGPLSERPAPSGTWTIGTVAMYRPRKGLEVLLDALARLRAADVPARLRIVGRFQTAEYEQEIHARVSAAGLEPWIDWVGFTRDVPGELDRMDVFVLPSILAEGMPMCILEAMAAGVPVIGSRVEGISDTIEDGVDGILVEPGSADDLAAAVTRLVRGELDWNALRIAAHRRQAAQFSDVAMAAAVAKLYRRILQRR